MIIKWRYEIYFILFNLCPIVSIEAGVVNTQFNIPMHEHSCEHYVLAYPPVYSYQEINSFPRQVFSDAFIKHLQKVTTSLYLPVCKFILPHGQ
jgi:hypothetical protein